MKRIDLPALFLLRFSAVLFPDFDIPSKINTAAATGICRAPAVYCCNRVIEGIKNRVYCCFFYIFWILRRILPDQLIPGEKPDGSSQIQWLKMSGMRNFSEKRYCSLLIVVFMRFRERIIVLTAGNTENSGMDCSECTLSLILVSRAYIFMPW